MYNQLHASLHGEYEAVKLLHTDQNVLETKTNPEKTMHIRACLWQWSTKMKFMQIQRGSNKKVELYPQVWLFPSLML